MSEIQPLVEPDEGSIIVRGDTPGHCFWQLSGWVVCADGKAHWIVKKGFAWSMAIGKAVARNTLLQTKKNCLLCYNQKTRLFKIRR